MTDYGTSNIYGSTGGQSGPPLRRDFVSVTNMENGFENVRVQAERRAGQRWQITERPTNPSEREGAAALPYTEILCPSPIWKMVLIMSA